MSEAIEPSDHRAQRRHFSLFFRALNPARKNAAIYILRDLNIAVGGTREIGEIARNYSNSLADDNPDKDLAIGHIARLLDSSGKNRSLWNVEAVDIEERNREKRAALTPFGREALLEIEKIIDSGVPFRPRKPDKFVF
ncbi:MAG: hypothetical protein H7267_13820 [Sandarakinorhabdus sp.]|nr:hypothetical protein [Sandarakinorhabdus sp.]